MTTATQSARVDVLTAEVRVLMVGSRQVTLSVYRQLDFVPPDQMEPFGRVRDTTHSSDDVVQVIGSDLQTDSLVRCNLDLPNWPRRWGPTAFRHWRCHVSARFAYSSDCPRCLPHMTQVSSSVPHCCEADLDGLRAEWESDAPTELLSAMESYEWAKTLPLIVLAGLK